MPPLLCLRLLLGLRSLLHLALLLLLPPHLLVC
jgi:hypothetical protein